MHEEKKPTGPMRVAFYLRVSTEDQAERYGIPMQKDALLNLIKSRGKLSDGSDALIFAGDKYVYIDDGISGTVPISERPAFSRLQEDIVNAPKGAKPFDIVAVFKIDRFARKLKVLLDVLDIFKEYDIEFLSAHESIDTSTPFGRAILGIIGVIAELELENIKLRTQAGREEAIKQGKTMGSVAPYGFIKNEEGRLERFEPEAKIVERIFDLFVNERMSTQDIASLLKGEKILAPSASAVLHGKRRAQSITRKTPNEFWRAERIMRTLKDERYVGTNYYNRYSAGGILRPREEWKTVDNHRLPQIIDLLTFDKTQKLLLSQKHERKTAHSDHLYLLRGLLQCDACGNETEGYSYWSGNRRQLRDRTGRFTYYYHCGGKDKNKSTKSCGVIPLPAQEVEDFILKECLRIINNPEGVYEHQQKLTSSQQEKKHLQKQQQYSLDILNGMPRQRDLIRQQHTEGIIDMPKLKAELAEIDEREKKLKNDLGTIDEKLSQTTVSLGYVKALDSVAERYKRYGGSLEKIKKDRKEAYELVHSLIDSVMVYSRPIVESDNIAGKKKTSQQIPDELVVKLKLPHEFLKETLITSSHQNALNRADGRN